MMTEVFHKLNSNLVYFNEIHNIESHIARLCSFVQMYTLVFILFAQKDRKSWREAEDTNF